MPNQPDIAAETAAVFLNCEKLEKLAENADLKRLRLELYKLQFTQPFFEPDEQLDPPASQTDSPEVKIEKKLRSAARYPDLVEFLRKARGRDALWLALGWWLNREGISKPDEFFPAGFLERSAKQAMRGFSLEKVRRCSQVEAWMPYFGLLFRMREDLKAAGKHDVAQGLVNRGFDQLAVEQAMPKRSVQEAVYAWLAAQGKGSIEVFRNAHSGLRTPVPVRGQS